MRYRNITIILALFVLALLPRVILINDGLYHHDSVGLAKSLEQGNLEGRTGVLLLSGLFYMIYPDAYAVLTYLTIVLASLSIVMVYLLIKELYGVEFIAVSSALLFAFCPLYLSITTYAKGHSFAIFFFLLSFLLFVKSLKISNPYLTLVSSIVYIISLLMRFDNILLFPLFIVCLYVYRDNGFIDQLVGFVLPLVMAGLYHILYGLFWKSDIDVLMLPKTQSYMTFAVYNLIHSMTPIVFLILMISVFLVSKRNSLFLLFWFAIIFIPLSLMINSGARYFVAALIPLFCLMSIMLYKLKRYKYYALAVIVIIMFVSIVPVLHARHKYSSGKELALWLRDNVPVNSCFDFEDHEIFVEYYTDIRCDGGDVYVLENLYKNQSAEVVGEVYWEDFHHSELSLGLHNETIYKLI